eukprot:TRINITY_DN12910_c0_g1_i2.p1 TRINITY_DN12910_c0_g1~~TRINITY_DN12910_c0_g1_i2.p1  ORF type:complete len:196 (+),score=39.38 TRINITY_DN12910_c0_g1_i2:1757-2344(+)
MSKLDLSVLDEQDKCLAIIFMFKYYIPDLDLWTINYMVHENTFSGHFITTPITSFVFQPHIQETGRERSLVMCDSFVFVLSMTMVGICAIEIHLKNRLHLMKFFKFSYVLSYINLIASLCVLIGIGRLRKSTDKLLVQPDSPSNFISFYDWYQAVTYAQYLQLACLVLFLLRWTSLLASARNVLFILNKVRFFPT